LYLSLRQSNETTGPNHIAEGAYGNSAEYLRQSKRAVPFVHRRVKSPFVSSWHCSSGSPTSRPNSVCQSRSSFLEELALRALVE
jgi:hypothetical protein